MSSGNSSSWLVKILGGSVLATLIAIAALIWQIISSQNDEIASKTQQANQAIQIAKAETQNALLVEQNRLQSEQLTIEAQQVTIGGQAPFPTDNPSYAITATVFIIQATQIEATSQAIATKQKEIEVTQTAVSFQPTNCVSSHLGSGKQFNVTLLSDCYYHFNISCNGCVAGQENNYLVYYAGNSVSVTVPDGSVWQYSNEPSIGEFSPDCDALSNDFWPSQLPAFLNISGIRQIWPCGIK